MSVGWGLEKLPGPRGKERLEVLRGKEVGLGVGLGGGKVMVRMQGLGLRCFTSLFSRLCLSVPLHVQSDSIQQLCFCYTLQLSFRTG